MDADVSVPSTAAPSGRRQVFAAGDVVARRADGLWRLRVEAPFPKQGWLARQPATLTRALFPGTTIEHEGRLYEVIAQAPLGVGVCYELADWADDLPIRQILRYDRASAEAELAARGTAQRNAAVARALRWLSPLVGLLPAAQQRQLEARYGVSAIFLTTCSALPLLLVAVPVEILGIAAQMAGGFGGSSAAIAWAARLLPVSTYLVLESALRLASAKLADEPIGSLLVTSLVSAARAARALARGQSVAAVLALQPGPPTGRPQAARLAVACDEVRPLADNFEGDLEVLSLLPKEHWTLRTLIWVGDTSYVLDHRELVAAGDGPPRHRFVLRRAEPEQLFSSVAQYQPDEVQGLVREALRRQRLTWVETFAQVWGLLDADLQAELARVYGYKPEQNTAWSIIGVAALAAIAGWLALGYLARAGRGLEDLAVLLAALYFSWETLQRTRALRQERIVGSALGRLIRPFGERLLTF